eukprot:6212300-Pleurochrysis_carterae.AAC.2
MAGQTQSGLPRDDSRPSAQRVACFVGSASYAYVSSSVDASLSHVVMGRGGRRGARAATAAMLLQRGGAQKPG